jgi:hypothetical protein
MATKKTQKNAYNFVCENCHFKSVNKYDYKRHLSTVKHKNNALSTCFVKGKEYSIDLDTDIKKYKCDNCCKLFSDRSGLWRHKKNYKCFEKEMITNEDSKDDKELILEILKQNTELIKENSEFKQLMLEQNKTMTELAKNAGYNTNNIHNTTNNNNFNINLYLNETCKNAMNIMDFINQLPVSIKNLEETGQLGFAEGISKIFINGLKQINVSDRPIHCADFKRETLYIKDNNEWNKETDNKTILTNAIKHVAHKNMKQIFEWTKIHPEYNDSSSKENDRYLKIVSESMSGSSEEESNKNYSKIIKNIVKETVINKSAMV